MTSSGKRSGIDACTELINQAMRCLENNDKDCVLRKIEELVRNQCHDGRLVGGEIADRVRDLFHELWMAMNYIEKGELLRRLNVSKSFLAKALHKPMREIKWYIKRYGLGVIES